VEVANPIYDVVFKYLMEDERILRWLLMAATNARMRHDMNVEDEYFSIIEKQDTEILMKTRELAERTVELAEKDSQLAESKSQLQKTIQMLCKAGLSPESIANSLGKGVEEIRNLIDS
jgi:hypothetical protein